MLRLLISQVVAAGLAAVVFRLGLEPRVAGLIAGSAFIAVGVFGVRIGWKARPFGVLGYVVLMMALVHLLGVAIPMLGFRVLNWGEPFSKVAVWGLSGPEFHALSTRLYGLWMVFAAVAWWRIRGAESAK
jgi:hypothetical protein